MLDTVLEIGRVLRASPDGLKHHRYIKAAPTPDEKRNPVRFWTVPVDEEGSFDFLQISSLDDENKKKRLLYLNYKESDADSSKKYLFGDIYRTVSKTTETGNFLLGDPTKASWSAVNSFQRAEKVIVLATKRVEIFREAFRQQMRCIETFLRVNPNVYVHFDFCGYCWHELEEMEILNTSLLNTFFDQISGGYIARAFLYKTLAIGNSNTPNFQEQGRHKIRLFTSREQALDLIYGIGFASRSVLRVRDMSLTVLPRGEGLTAGQIERFFNHLSTGESELDAEAEVQHEVEQKDQPVCAEDVDPLFAMLADHRKTRSFAQFDFVFSIAGGMKADIDLIELSGLERSSLLQIRDRIETIRRSVENDREALQFRLYGKPPKKPLAPIRVTRSFLNILSNKTSKEKKYQSHLYKVLPQIYTETYYRDPVLLPAFIERIQANIRNGTENFNLLKFDFYFLTRLQNNQGEHFVEIENRPSYRVGLLLGRMARGLRPKINSFDKNYAGLLSRRIGTLNDVISLQNEFNQKLIMHDRASWSFTFSDELTCEVKVFAGPYNKDECAFGFFESYFAPRKSEEEDTTEQVQA